MTGLLEYLGGDDPEDKKRKTPSTRKGVKSTGKGVGPAMRTYQVPPQKTLGGPSKDVGPAMKEVKGRRVPNAALEGPTKAATSSVLKKGGMGLLRTLGGPAALALEAGLTPGELGNSDLESSKEGASNWVNENPEEAVNATGKINSLVNRSIQEAKDKWTPPPVQEQEVSPQAPPQAPAPDPEQQKQIEIQRQTVETGALKGLETGQVSRPGLAEAIVDADAQRAGEQLTPEQSKQAVQQELVSMKSMDNSELSKYVSYALIAGGVLASFLDKSGKSADMFHESFNRQLDRNEEAKERAAAAEQAALKHALDERRVAATETDVGSKVVDREETRELTRTKNEGLLDKWENEANLGRARFSNELNRTGLMYNQLDADIQDKNIKNNLAARKADQYERRLGQWDRQLEQNAASGGGSGTGVPLSYEDNTKMVSDVLSAKGIKVSKEVKQALAARLPTIQKLTPNLSATQMTEIALDEISGEISSKEPGLLGRLFGQGDTYSFDKLQ